ncbi:hypothetical protein NUSPORA_00079 [Nucleospora cyclopteri]
MSFETPKNIKNDIPAGTVECNPGRTIEDNLHLAKLDFEVKLKVHKILDKIEEELDHEMNYINYQEYKAKKSRLSQVYIRPIELKTNYIYNAEEDIFEIEGGKDAIIAKIKEFKAGDPILCLLRRKKIKGIFEYFNDKIVAFRSNDKKIYEMTYKQIDEDKIRFERY